MKVSGTARLNAPVEQVWQALNDPAVLVRTIPGCEQLEAVGADRYRMTVTAGVASIKGTYLGDVELADQQPPGAFTLRASGAGAPGTVQADVKVRLDDAGDGGTTLTYDADAVVGGPVGGVGQRMLAGVARKTAGEFFRAVDDVLTGAAPPTRRPRRTAARTPAMRRGRRGRCSRRQPDGASPAGVFRRPATAPRQGQILVAQLGAMALGAASVAARLGGRSPAGDRRRTAQDAELMRDVHRRRRPDRAAARPARPAVGRRELRQGARTGCTAAWTPPARSSSSCRSPPPPGSPPALGPEELWDLVSTSPARSPSRCRRSARALGVHVVWGTYERGERRGEVYNSAALSAPRRAARRLSQDPPVLHRGAPAAAG